MSDNTRAEDRESVDSATEPSVPASSTEQELTRGRDAETPFFVLGGLAAAIAAVVTLVALGLLLIWWIG